MPKNLALRWTGLLLLLLNFVSAHQTRAQSFIQIVTHNVSYVFNERLYFEATFESDKPLAAGRVVFHQERASKLETERIELNGNSKLSIDFELDVGTAPEAFSKVIYWFVVATQDGLAYESPAYEFLYEDNRFEWQTLEASPFQVRWHSGGGSFGESILSAAKKGVARTQQWLPLAAPSQIILQVYEYPSDVQEVLQLAGYSWLGGHSDPVLGRILLSIPPNSQSSLEIERQVPHEVAHVMLFQALGPEAYGNLPIWLTEGIASNAELYSDPVRGQLLNLAYGGNHLLPIAGLCEVFPQTTANARLAYAEVASFVDYLHEEYGVVGLGALIDAYSENFDCLNAPRALFGMDLGELEQDWISATFSPSSSWQTLLESLPWQSILVSGLFVGTLFLLQRALAKRGTESK